MIIIPFIAFVFATAVIDAEHLQKQEYIKDHFSRFAQRFIVFCIIAAFNWQLAFGFGLIFAALFDQILNKLRDLPPFYLGTVAKWDLFFRRFKWLYISLKVISLIGGVYLCW